VLEWAAVPELEVAVEPVRAAREQQEQVGLARQGLALA
jgi:hypothetical protein